MKSYHNRSVEQTLADFKVAIIGLSESEVMARANTKKDDENKPKKQGIVSRFFEQFHDLMIIILLLASAVSIIIHGRNCGRAYHSCDSAYECNLWCCARI